MREVLRRIKRKGIEGFTLTEILVVVLIAAVISAIAYPLYTKSVLKARAVEAVSLLEIVKTKQASRYIVSRNYYVSFENMGQLTQYKGKEKVNTSDNRIIEIGDYKLVMNDEDKCLTAQYKDKFTLSTGYEDSKIGCSGEVCASFGGVVGKAEEVCRVESGEGCVSGGSSSCTGSSSCSNGYSSSCKNCSGTTLYTCKDTPAQVCTPKGTRICGSGCGTQTCKDDGSGWEGTCSSPKQNQETSKACTDIDSSLYGGGMASRTCSATCGGGKCGEWDKSKCTAITKECPQDSKPAEQTSCGTCGTQRKKVSCDETTGEWSAVNEGSCVEATKPETEEECGCKNGGKKTRTPQCTAATATTEASWSEPNWGECSISDECPCDDTDKPKLTRDCGNKCGKESGTVECNTITGQWNDVVWSGSCSIEECHILECETYTNQRFAGLDEYDFMLYVDTCDGNNENLFTCSGNAKTCVDVYYNVDNTAANTGVNNRHQKITELGLVTSGIDYGEETCAVGDVINTFSCDREYDQGATYYSLAAYLGGVFKCIDVYQPEQYTYINEYYKREVECRVKKLYTARDVVCGDAASCK